MIPLRAMWFGIGMVALALGGLGVVLPLLPTTPFVILAAFAFAKSSQRWHGWLISHRIFGPMIRDWRAYGAIHPRGKLFAVLSITGVFAISLILQVPLMVLSIQALVLMAVTTFILTRPNPPTS